MHNVVSIAHDSDARTLVDRARIDAQNHRFTYDEPIKVSGGRGMRDERYNRG